MTTLLQLLRQQLKVIRESPQIRVLVSAVLSALIWFCWAYWANSEDPHHALLSGLSQGGVSFTTTFIGTFLLELLYQRMGGSQLGRVITAGTVCALSLTFMITVHTLAGTPNPVMTILPVFSVVVIYCGSYVYGLHKIRNQIESDAVEVASS